MGWVKNELAQLAYALCLMATALGLGEQKRRARMPRENAMCKSLWDTLLQCLIRACAYKIKNLFFNERLSEF